MLFLVSVCLVDIGLHGDPTTLSASFPPFRLIPRPHDKIVGASRCQNWESLPPEIFSPIPMTPLNQLGALMVVSWAQ